jgi:hypothetical protein
MRKQTPFGTTSHGMQSQQPSDTLSTSPNEHYSRGGNRNRTALLEYRRSQCQIQLYRQPLHDAILEPIHIDDRRRYNRNHENRLLLPDHHPHRAGVSAPRERDHKDTSRAQQQNNLTKHLVQPPEMFGSRSSRNRDSHRPLPRSYTPPESIRNL